MGEKKKDKWKNHNLPRGNCAKLKLLGNMGRENNVTVNFIMARSPSDLDRLLSMALALLFFLELTDFYS